MLMKQVLRICEIVIFIFHLKVIIMRTPTAFEWHNVDTGHCYVDYISKPLMDENNGYTKIPLFKEVEETSDESDKADDEFVESYMTAEDEQDKKCESCDVPIPCDMECEQPTAEEIKSNIKTKECFYFNNCEKCGKLYYHNKSYHLTSEKLLCIDCSNNLKIYAQSQKPSRERIIEVLKKYETWDSIFGKNNPFIWATQYNTIADELLKPE
jgi:hypothetical protein